MNEQEFVGFTETIADRGRTGVARINHLLPGYT